MLLVSLGVLALIAFGYAAVMPLSRNSAPLLAKLAPTPTPYAYPYIQPAIAKNRSYRMVIVGDSIVQTLGANANGLREALIERYPQNEFVTYNYGFGATNVLSLVDRLTTRTTFDGAEYVPILKQGFELIIIESFGYNPLSELALEDGLAAQEAELERAVQLILTTKPGVALAFMTPPALGAHFAAGTYDLSDEVRREWIDERLAYIANHKQFAQARGIPIIDVFAASLGTDGQVRPEYVSADNIHPSKAGVALMETEIADYILENSVFPK